MKTTTIVILALCLGVAVGQRFGFERFYLTFRGVDSSNTTGTALAKANSQQTTTLIDNNEGVTYEDKYFMGTSATWNTTFDWTKPMDSGSIYFGVPSPSGLQHAIAIKLLNFEYVENWHGLKRGAGTYNITGGLGAFKGSEGLLSFIKTTNTTANKDGSYESEIHAQGIFYFGAPPALSPLPPASVHV